MEQGDALKVEIHEEPAKEVWKYPLLLNDMQSIDMPAGAKFLTVQVQDDQACLWALVEPQAAREPRVLETYGTGHRLKPVDDQVLRREYVGTYQAGSFVYHVFELLVGRER